MRVIELILAGSLSWAGGGAESCLNSCTIELGENGKTKTVCRCDLPDSITKLWGKEAKPRSLKVWQSRLLGAKPEDLTQVATNACGSSAPAKRNPTELKSLAKLTQRPLCECVKARVYFPLRKSCTYTPAGETLCTFARAERPVEKARAVSLYDYQSCVSDRQNYEPPASCGTGACPAGPTSCASNERLTNIADPESCCPVFVCQPLPTETL